MTQENYSFAGYSFDSIEEMEMAKKEAAGIKHINSKINYDDVNSLHTIYNKLLDRDLFSTVVGIDFLRNIRRILMEQYDLKASEVRSIPVHFSGISQEEIKITNEIKKSVSTETESGKKKRVDVYKYKKPFIISVVVAALLVVVLILGFRVLSDSDNLNIVNYQERLERQYQSWEEELTERERELNEAKLLK